MLSWKIGDVTVTRIVEHEFELPYDPNGPLFSEASPEALREMPWLYPHYVTPEGALKNSIHALVVQAPGLTLIVDTCIGEDKPRESMGGHALPTTFLKDFAAAGFSPDDVDVVVCTHLHMDHVGWNTYRKGDAWVPTFPNACYLFGRAEYEHCRQDNSSSDSLALLADSVQPVFDAGLAEFVEQDHRISPELRLVPTPGHTPGHVSVLIESRGEVAMITGDMMHHPCQIARPQWSARVDADKMTAVATRHQMIEEWTSRPMLVIGTHFTTPTAGRVRKYEDGGHWFEGV